MTANVEELRARSAGGYASGWLRDESVAAALEKINDAIAALLAPGPLSASEGVFDVVFVAGKRMRAALLLLSTTFGDRMNDDAVRLAAAVELLHAGSLYHDDIIDRSSRRRGVVSANARFGDQAAALVGTYLFAQATREVLRHGPTVHRLTAHAAAQLYAGQLSEVETAYDTGLDEDVYLDTLKKKTAALVALPCLLGALLGGLSARLTRCLGDYGRSLGVAFQLADDVLDLVGDPDATGKAVGTDLVAGVYSLPVRLSLGDAAVGADLKRLLSRRTLATEDVVTALELVRRGPGVPATRARAREYGELAAAAAGELPRGAARQSLLDLTRFAVERAG